MAATGEDDREGQGDPVCRHDTREAASKVMGQSRRRIDIVIMYIQNDEAADDEKQIDTGVSKLQRVAQPWYSMDLINMAGCMIQNDSGRRHAATGLDTAEPTCRVMVAHPSGPRRRTGGWRERHGRGVSEAAGAGVNRGCCVSAGFSREM